MKRLIAMVLCICMVLSMAACGQPKVQTGSSLTETSQMSRQDKELIAELVGGVDASDLSDEELDALVEQLVGNKDTSSQVVNLNAGQKTEEPSVDVTQNPEVYDENGAMTKPFDQVYPELIEQGQVKFSGESILVKLASDTLTAGLKAAGVGALEQIVPMEKASWYEAKLVDGTEPKKALEAVRELDEVLLAEFNYEIQTAALDDYKHFDKEQDEDFKKNGHNKDQWHFHHCGIPDGYEEMEIPGGDSSVIVAVIDSGVDYTHEDLKDNMWVNAKEIPDNNRDDDGNGYVDDYYGIDLVAGKGNGGDTNGHGTHVAGIIAAKNNNTGTLGIAYNVKIMSVKAAAHNGTLNQANIAKAVLYACQNGAEVINMSFGGTACSIAVQDALEQAYTQCVLVASAGNNGAPNEGLFAIPNYPAALTYVLGVMSVDEAGRESVFSNYDVSAFNGVEYELYAPGENIMSTLPGNKYGYLSGTSMAAPVVSAFAAILRSEFSDRDMYPTKFIYGQLAATSQIQADCLDPKEHGLHNLPQVVDLNAALTNMPKPEVGLQDYYLFDSPEFSEKNNGDGVIDAGETIALGLTLRNRWGMSENTLVTIDTKSSISGISDPYFEILNPTVNYGSVGTYSTQDAGKLYTDELFTAWEKPFMIQVSEDCPNDYRFTLNVTVTCENALDKADETVYTSVGTVDESVRAGYILPSIIEEDMTLTKDNLYIIPNATIITEGTTVRVEPGTHIQFWSDDADDPYADNYIAYLLVNGKFLVEGTKEEPVYIYPSQLMDHYNVEFGSSNRGYISLKYADITNFAVCSNNTGTYNQINDADHCTFRINYGTSISYRYLYEGVVEDSNTSGFTIGNINAKDSVFYRIGSIYSDCYLSGSFDRCIFTHCGIDYDNGTYKNCVFLGNSFVDQTNSYYISNSSYRAEDAHLPTAENAENGSITIYYRPETGTTYVEWSGSGDSGAAFAEYLKQMYGGGFAKVETKDELYWLRDRASSYRVSMRWDQTQGQLLWHDGTPVSLEIFPNAGEYKTFNRTYVDSDMQLHLSQNSWSGDMLYEIPGQILPTDITFREYAVDMDLEAAYQLTPLNTPVQLDVADFRYESGDESVVTVSDTGLVTPVGTGTADVWVWSLDKAIRNRVTFTVREYVALEGLELTAPVTELAAGEKIALSCALTPENTTRKNVNYTTSDPAIATVDAGGILTGKASGKVTVTASCEGFTDSVELTVYVKATELSLARAGMVADLADGVVELPDVITNSGAETILSWRSTDESVATIEEGKLALKALGTTSIVVTDSRSGLSAACLVIVQEGKTAAVKQMCIQGSYYAVLLEDGSLYGWTSEYQKTPKLLRTSVVAIGGSGSLVLAALEDGTLEEWSFSYSNPGNAIRVRKTYTDFVGKKIAAVELYSNYFVVTEDGTVYGWGKNYNGSLGVGFTDEVSVPMPLDLESVVQLECYDSTTWFHTKDGKLYVAGYYDEDTVLNPLLVATDVKKLMETNTENAWCMMSDGSLCWFTRDGYYNSYTFELEDPEDMASGSYIEHDGWGSYPGVVLLKDGKVYRAEKTGYYAYDFATKQVPGITNAKRIFSDGQTYYVSTEDGMLLAFGDTYANATAGATAAGKVTTPVTISLLGVTQEALALTDDNLTEGILTQSALELRFNKELVSAAPKLYMEGVQIAMSYTISDTNALVITRNSGFTVGATYQLVLPAGTVHGAMNVVNDKDLVIDFAVEAGQETPDVLPDGELPETVEKVFYKAIVDSSVERILTPKSLVEKLEAYKDKTQLNPDFVGNAILNPISTDFEPSHWLRIQAPSVSVGEYKELPLGGNWWGSVNDRAIGLQMIDYTDFPNYYRLMYAPFLTEAPENTFPFVTSVKLFNAEGEEVTTVGNEKVLFQVKFNRDMDTSIPLQVRFGSAYPYGDYELEGQYVDARTWECEYTLNTLIENGNQFFTISNGCSATDDLELQLDRGRFTFEIDTTAAQALIMQGAATSTGIELKWTQDDFKTLMGYNVYRSTAEDGLYTRLNDTVIPADVMSWFDTTVEPGVVYYYNFTVVQTDLSESVPSGKIVIMSKDTMAPNVYHSPAGSAFTGSNMVISATITDNLNIAYANLYYRVAGTDSWITIRMNKLNDKYSAIIPAAYVTTAGVEYYIEAFDGISYTYNGSEAEPYTVTVQEAIDANALGDVDGDGVITNLDALLLLYTINDKYNMTAEEFARADLNGDGELWAAEALRILQYVSGAVGSVKM